MKRKPRGILRTAVAFNELRPTPYGIGPLVVFALLLLFSGLGQEFFTVAGPNIAQDLNLDLKTVGGILSTVAIIGLFASVLIGWLADRVRRVWLSGGSTILGGLSLLAQS